MNTATTQSRTQTIADLSFRLDLCVALAASLAEQAREAIELLAAMPATPDAARPAKPSGAQYKKMHVEDLKTIVALHAKGHGLDALVAVTGFSQCQCFAVMAGRYAVDKIGRVYLDASVEQVELDDEADAAAQWQRAGGADLWAVQHG